MNKEQATRQLLKLGACWDSYSRPGHYRTHPVASYPHEKDIIELPSLKEVAAYIKMRKQVAGVATEAEAVEIYDEWKYS